MKALSSAASLGLCSLLLFPQQALPIPIRSLTNILGNGGFETWSEGFSFQGPIGPDGWYAMGNTSDVFTQGDIAFTRITGCPPGGSGSPLMQIRANQPQNFVSQSAENYFEYAGKDLTFSLSARPLFPLANARIEIDDGVSTSSALITVTMGQWGRVTVRHTVASCPTKLEFRIYPEQTIDVEEAMAVVGRQPSAEFIPRPNLDPGLREVPLGTVLDWYRFDTSIPVPQGFAICDGSPVADPASPFVGRATPNLLNRFVRGVTSVAAIGTTGGSTTTSAPNLGSGSPPSGAWFILQFPIGPVILAANEFHTHNHTPPYVGLLKLIRIK